MITPTGWTTRNVDARPALTFAELRTLVERECGNCRRPGCHPCLMLAAARREARHAGVTCAPRRPDDGLQLRHL